MYEHEKQDKEQQGKEQGVASVSARTDAIEVGDFVYAATGARVRRLTMPDGTHWFPAADVCRELGYSTTRKALLDHVPAPYRDFLETVTTSHSLSVPAGREWRRDLQLIDLQGLIRLVAGCTKLSCEPFKAWMSEVIATVQREGSYTLPVAEVQPAENAATSYAMPHQMADAIVRLEARSIRAEEAAAAAAAERNALLREQSETLKRIADGMDRFAERVGTATGEPDTPTVTPQEMLAEWRAKNLVVTDDVHAVAAYLAPALLRGEAHYRFEEIAERTGLTVERVHDCVRMLIKRGCMRQAGCAPDGAGVYVLP